MKNKLISTLIIFLVYTLGITGMVFLYPLIQSVLQVKANEPLMILLILDIIFTIWIFIFSLIFKNSSMYDPYWSITPVWLIIMYIVKAKAFNLYTIILLVVFLIWSIRLTLNWLLNFKNLTVSDWRYTNLKQKHPKLWFIINFFGIHLMPTLVVFLAMLPAFNFIDIVTTKDIPTISTWLGVVVSIIGVVISGISDLQMFKFRQNKENTGKIMTRGLWKKSRHPNYFGEILFWFGICMMGISFQSSQNWILITSPVIVLLLFSFISVPMMEKHMLEKNKDYKEYKEKTNTFFIFF